MSPIDFGEFKRDKSSEDDNNVSHSLLETRNQPEVHQFHEWSQRTEKSRKKLMLSFMGKVSERLVRSTKKSGFMAWACLFGTIIMTLVMVALTANKTISVAVVVLIVVIVAFGIYRVYARSEVLDFVAPDQVVLPDRGFSKIHYFVNDKFGRPDLVPEISKEQARDVFEQQIGLLEDRVKVIFNSGVHPNIWIGNQKGSSAKSVMAVIMGEIIAEITRGIVVLLPASTSTQTATAGKLAGVRGKTLTLRQYSSMLKSGNVTFHDLSRSVAVTKSGLYVISEDTQSSDKSNFSKARWEEVYNHLRKNSSVIISDTGNDDAYRYTVTSAGIRQADVVVVPANRLMIQTLQSAGATLAYYMQMQRGIRQSSELTKDGAAIEGASIPVSEKLLKSIVVLNAYNPEEGHEDFMSRLIQGIKQSGEDPSKFSDTRVFGIHRDDHLYKTDEGLDYSQMARTTYFDYLVVVVAVFEQAAKLQEVTIPERDWLIKNVGIIMPSPS